MENGPGPGEVHGKGRIIGPAPPVIESGGKHVKILANTLKFSNWVLARVQINNNNYEQPIALFVIILAKNTFTNRHGVIYCWRQVEPQYDGGDLY